MRTLPKIKSVRQRLIIDCTHDYFGVAEMTRPNQIALFLMGRKRGVILSVEEMEDMRCIKINMEDKVYIESFSKQNAR